MKEWAIKFIREWSEAIAEALVIVIALNILLWPIKVSGVSMAEAVNDGDWVFGCKLAAWVSEPKSGEIVMFNVDGVKDALIKRVIATQGDTVEIRDGLVFVNGEELKESYIDTPTDGDFKIIVKSGYFFALGDNRAVSTDSRSFGQVSSDSIKSKILFRFYPFDKVRAYFLEREL